MNQYEQTLTSALQSQVDKRAGKITSLELFREGYKFLGRLKDKREVEVDLEKLRVEQLIAKRTLGMLTEYRRYTNYLNDIVDEHCLVSQ